MGGMIAAPDRDPFAFLNCSPNYRTATQPKPSLAEKNPCGCDNHGFYSVRQHHFPVLWHRPPGLIRLGN